MLFCGFESVKETSYLLRQNDYPSIPSTGTVCGEKKVSFAPPPPYLWSSTRAVHLLFSVQMNSVSPVTGLPLPVKRTAVTQTAHEPLVTFENFSVHVHHAHFNIAQNIRVFILFLSNPRGRGGGQAIFFFNFIHVRVCSEWLSKLSLVRCIATFYGALWVSSLADIYRLCFDYFSFSLILKGFIIGQELNYSAWSKVEFGCGPAVFFL